MMVKAEENKLNRLGGTIAYDQHIEDACKQDACKIKTPLRAATDVVRSATKVYWLSGLTCTDENFSQKAGAFQAACDNQVPVEWHYTDFYFAWLRLVTQTWTGTWCDYEWNLLVKSLMWRRWYWWCQIPHHGVMAFQMRSHNCVFQKRDLDCLDPVGSYGDWLWNSVSHLVFLRSHILMTLALVLVFIWTPQLTNTRPITTCRLDEMTSCSMKGALVNRLTVATFWWKRFKSVRYDFVVKELPALVEAGANL